LECDIGAKHNVGRNSRINHVHDYGLELLPGSDYLLASRCRLQLQAEAGTAVAEKVWQGLFAG
jgi:hypothetical protein